ncbi:MAG: hypothetical protein ABH860_00670 [bacterium]
MGVPGIQGGKFSFSSPQKFQEEIDKANKLKKNAINDLLTVGSDAAYDLRGVVEGNAKNDSPAEPFEVVCKFLDKHMAELKNATQFLFGGGTQGGTVAAPTEQGKEPVTVPIDKKI